MPHAGRARRRLWTLGTLDRSIEFRLWWNETDLRWEVDPLLPARLEPAGGGFRAGRHALPDHTLP